MFLFKNKVVTVLVDIFLFIWQLPQVLVGLVMLAVFHNCKLYTNPNSGISVFRINCNYAFGNACFSSGPFIVICSEDAGEDTVKHETGHSFQSLCLSWLYFIIIAIPSVCLFWYRKLNNKDSDFYLSHFPENWAEKAGKTDRYIAKMESEEGDTRMC